ncbi:transcriptional regulator, LacI family [Limosilactobacillus coleohominis 101-4-CHN]|uniref:Transcriptional regulator, LacI family n=1 Tax=Limosilactobacillus coleohominis 101-4-CHN TaxID=575594 RepID=C7XTK1_9LACO|nr:LacI family DNA-binding transcriptional regulator [Limosilactobacillus coleohominis]EEU31174.1 transcriptional regulator, LacI family [Limosilactobacillus coleohominis 101-4-CHN]
MTNKITIKDVAEKAGVSVTTVSQILNGKGARFSKKTQERVLKLKDEMHYVPDFNARNLILHSSKTIGVLVPNIGNPFFSTFFRGIQTVCRNAHYLPLVFSASNDETTEKYYLGNLVERSVDGLIIASSSVTADTIDNILKPNRIPYLLFDRNQINDDGDRLQVDDYQGGSIAAEHLAKLGHKRIVVMMPKQLTRNLRKRLDGFINGLLQRGIHFNEEQDLVAAPLTKLGGYEQTDAVLKRRPTAVFCGNDELAIGLYRGLHEREIQIPEDLSVMGYDNIDLAEYVTPKLTTIEQPILELGETSARLILNRINDLQMSRQLVDVPVKLTERSSTGRPVE